jgi:hypothetical protein
VTLINLNPSVAGLPWLPWLPLHIKAATTTTKRELLRVAAEAATSRMVRPFHNSAHALIMLLTSASLPLQGARDNQLTVRNATAVGSLSVTVEGVQGIPLAPHSSYYVLDTP